jgi:hypothetical protein
MIRVNLFDPLRPSIYGTATGRDILSVCCAAALFCLAMALIPFGVVQVLLAMN